MNFKYTKAKSKETPKDIYQLTLSWMSGDADHYDVTVINYNTENELIAALTLVNGWFELKAKHHNMCCNLTDGNKVNKYWSNGEVEAAFNFLKGNTLSELFETVDIESVHDVTCEDRSASLDSIESIKYFDKAGIEYDVEQE